MVAQFRKTKKRFKNPFVLHPFIVGLSLLFIITFLGVSNWKIVQKRGEFNNKIEILRTELQKLEERNKILKEEIRRAQTEETIEEIARNQLNLKKPGERIVGIIKEAKKEEKKEKQAKKGFWDKFLEIFPSQFFPNFRE